jgi:TolB protein
MPRGGSARLLAALALLAGCEASAPAVETRETVTPLDVRGDSVLFGVGPEVKPESDALPSRALVRLDTRTGTRLPIRTRATWAALGPAATFLVSPAGELVRADARGEHVLLDRALGKPAPRADGSVVVARRDGPGESDLWLVALDGTARALAPAPGPDDSPVALPDGRIAFVSGRTTLASLFVVDPDGGEPRQITNRGLVAGKPRPGFVPPPLRVLEAGASHLLYDAGGGELWRVDLATGAAQRAGGTR